MPSLKTPSTAKTKRKPGRPAESSEHDIRDLLLAAAAEAYAEHGYHDCTVAMILEASGVSRPTFYRYFKNRHEVLDTVIADVNSLLKAKAIEKVAGQSSMDDVITSGVDAYFEWGSEIGKVAGSIYREIHDAQSPASIHRKHIIMAFMEIIQQKLAVTGQSFNPVMLDALLHVVEYVGHQAFWPNTKDQQETLMLKQTILTIVKASLKEVSKGAGKPD